MTGLTYKDAGVDILAAEGFVSAIRSLMASTDREGRASSEGSFSGIFEVGGGMRLAASADGVGTKLLLATNEEHYRALGQDLVAMNVNDLLPVFAQPLFFLDYMAVGKIEHAKMVALVEGIADACRQSSCVLLGGETAEMPDLYTPGHFDLAGFSVGLVDPPVADEIAPIAEGDRIFGLPSNGVHANGFSLVRKAVGEDISEGLREALMQPTRIYTPEVRALHKVLRPKAQAHITGGGLTNRSRSMLSEGTSLGLRFDPSAWARPAVFDAIQTRGKIVQSEMYTSFNMGLGYLIIVAPTQAEHCRAQGWLEVGAVEGAAGVHLGDIPLDAGKA